MNHKVIILLLSFLYTVASHILQSYVLFGDHSLYKLSYESLLGIDIVEGYFIYNAQLGAGEPIYYIISYILSNLGVNFELFNSILNLIFVYLSISLLTRAGLSIFWIILIIFPSYYVLILNIDVLRLKTAIIFLALALLNNNSKKFYLISILSQFQIIGYYAASFFSVFISKFLGILNVKNWEFRFNFISILKNISILSISLIILFVFYSYLIQKITHYSYRGSILVLLQLFIFPLIIGLNFGFTSKNFYFLIPLVAMAFFVGPGRVTIMIYAAFLYMTTQLRLRKFLLINVPFSLYYLSKSYLYFSALIEHGSGFEYIDSI